MIAAVRAMPGGIRLFLVYALLILVAIGLSLRYVVDQAIAAPVSPLGVLVMVLLAYTIFTTTLVLQRKQAARGLAIGLASLLIPRSCCSSRVRSIPRRRSSWPPSGSSSSVACFDPRCAPTWPRNDGPAHRIAANRYPHATWRHGALRTDRCC